MHKSISRREMLQTSAGLLAAGAVYPLSASPDGPAVKTLHLPSLHDRAKLAMRCLIEHSDAARGYVPYFYTKMNDRPPSMFLYIWSYGDGMGRSVDALAMLRQITAEDPQPEHLRKAASILAGCAIDCWHQVRPAPPKIQISPLPAQPRAL